MRMLGDWKLAEGAYLAAAMKKPRRVIPVCTGLPPNGGPMWQLWTQNRGACAWCYHNTLGPIPRSSVECSLPRDCELCRKYSVAIEEDSELERNLFFVR